MPVAPSEPGPTGREMLADHVYRRLMLALVEGQLQADEPLNIDALARTLDVSPTPVREALARLQATGLVVRVALKGYRVAPLLSGSELRELMDARLVIEPENAYRACQRVDDRMVDRLQAAVDQLQDMDESNLAYFWQADELFHRLIAEATDNRFLLSAYNALGGHVQRFRLFGGIAVSDAAQAQDEHRVIIEAFRGKDADDARDAMREHIEHVLTRSMADAPAN